MISQYIFPHPYLEKKSPSAFLFPSEFFKKVLGEKNKQTKVYDHGGQATRGQKKIRKIILLKRTWRFQFSI